VRSLHAAWMLQRLGRTPAASVAGGMAAWLEQGLPLA
jgi:rhodanese-related sulfurtransferase